MRITIYRAGAFVGDDLSGHLFRAIDAGEIHIDHIVPVAAFNITSLDDAAFKACWALANLRPMWAKDNISKGSKRLFLL